MVASVLLSSVWWRASLLWLKSRSLLWPWMVIGARWLTAGSVRCWLGWGQTICGFCATDGQEAENTPESTQEQLNISPIALPIAYRILIPIAPAIGNRWYFAIASKRWNPGHGVQIAPATPGPRGLNSRDNNAPQAAHPRPWGLNQMGSESGNMPSITTYPRPWGPNQMGSKSGPRPCYIHKLRALGSKFDFA